MEKSFWRERWAAGQIGFHLVDVNPMLERFWPGVATEGGRVLVPLCGKSVDLTWLAQRGQEVVGVEFVAQAADEYFVERGVEASRKEVEGFTVLRGGGVSIAVADFFRVHSGVTGISDTVYDRAAWMAIAPEDRRKYTQQIRALVRPGARLLLVNFLHDTGTGPPFSIENDEVRATWEGFSLELRFERDALDDDPVVRARGGTRLREQVWIGVALA